MVDVLPATGLNVYSILQRQQLLMTRQAIDLAVQRLTRPINQRLPGGMASSGLPISELPHKPQGDFDQQEAGLFQGV